MELGDNVKQKMKHYKKISNKKDIIRKTGRREGKRKRQRWEEERDTYTYIYVGKEKERGRGENRPWGRAPCISWVELKISSVTHIDAGAGNTVEKPRRRLAIRHVGYMDDARRRETWK